MSDLFTEWEIILLLSSRCIILGVRDATYQSISVLTDQICVGFVPKGPNQKVPFVNLLCNASL